MSSAMACDLIAGDAGLLQDFARGRGQRPHVIVMRLRGIFRIFALAVQRILGDGGVEQATFAVDQRNANAQCSKINAGHDRHQQAPLSQP